MFTSVIALLDGTRICSGTQGENAIASVTLTSCVNEQKELTLGSVCAAMLEATVLTGEAGLCVQAGTELTLYRKKENEDPEQIGIFIADRPTRLGANKLKLTACDRVSLLEQDLSLWLEQLDGWPYTLEEFAKAVARACSLELDCTDMLNAQLPVYSFAATGITGRQLMRWIGQLCGRFCYAGADGKLYFGWYYDRGTAIGPTGAGFYYQGSLTYEDYTVSPIERVWLQQEQKDVGVVYPETAQSGNTYTVTANPLLAAQDTQTKLQVAQQLYELLRQVSYRPCRLQVSTQLQLRAGEIVTVTDSAGNTFTSYIMTRKQTAGRDTLECTGSANRQTAGVVNQLHHGNLSGRVFNLELSVDGLKTEASDQQTAIDGAMQDISVLEQTAWQLVVDVDSLRESQESTEHRTTQLELTAQGISSRVACQMEDTQAVKQELTRMEQTASDIRFAVQTIQDQGVDRVVTSTGYSFTEDGLRVQKEGQQMENLLTDKGMYVSCGDTVLLQADQEGVQATDVSVKNYLIVGEHCRLEDHTDSNGNSRTACFWIDA